MGPQLGAPYEPLKEWPSQELPRGLFGAGRGEGPVGPWSLWGLGNHEVVFGKAPPKIFLSEIFVLYSVFLYR